MPMPIFQSKPSGAMTGSMSRPRRPAKLWRRLSPAAWLSSAAAGFARAVDWWETAADGELALQVGALGSTERAWVAALWG